MLWANLTPSKSGRGAGVKGATLHRMVRPLDQATAEQRKQEMSTQALQIPRAGESARLREH